MRYHLFGREWTSLFTTHDKFRAVEPIPQSLILLQDYLGPLLPHTNQRIANLLFFPLIRDPRELCDCAELLLFDA